MRSSSWLRPSASASSAMPSSAASRSTPQSRAWSSRLRRPLRARSTTGSWKTTLLTARAASGCLATSNPASRALPPVGLTVLVSMPITVDLPAPLGPSRPNTSPAATSKSIPFTASTPPRYVFSRPLTSIAGTSTTTSCVRRPSHRPRFVRHPHDGCEREDVTVEDRDWLAEQFERQRPQLRAVAYRMLGSMSEADDAVQESWLRLNRSDTEAVSNLDGWLTTVVGRVCLDMLRARRA